MSGRHNHRCEPMTAPRTATPRTIPRIIVCFHPAIVKRLMSRDKRAHTWIFQKFEKLVNREPLLRPVLEQTTGTPSRSGRGRGILFLLTLAVQVRNARS